MIEAESKSVKSSLGLPTQHGLNVLFGKVERKAAEVSDAAEAFLKGDVSVERMREKMSMSYQ